MTPPPKFAHLPWHWIERGRRLEPARWISECWRLATLREPVTPQDAARYGWRYIAPAEPPEDVLGTSEAPAGRHRRDEGVGAR